MNRIELMNLDMLGETQFRRELSDGIVAIVDATSATRGIDRRQLLESTYAVHAIEGREQAIDYLNILAIAPNEIVSGMVGSLFLMDTYR